MFGVADQIEDITETKFPLLNKTIISDERNRVQELARTQFKPVTTGC